MPHVDGLAVVEGEDIGEPERKRRFCLERRLKRSGSLLPSAQSARQCDK
jgi:hypothetical protein